MAPLLIIGLGGSGVRVLLHLKHLLLNRDEGCLPENVRLLAFDVEAEAPALNDWIQLSVTEYASLRCNLHSLVCSVRAADHPHIGAWFPARHILGELVPAVLSFDRGGYPRSLGRLCLFRDLTTLASSKVYRCLSSSMEHLGVHFFGQDGIDTLPVYLVSSTFGSTGSAWVVDFAHLIREIGHQIGLEVALHAILLAPEAFVTMDRHNWPQALRARGLATLREIDRFQTAVIPERGYPMHYHDQGVDPVTRGTVRHRLFESVILLDGNARQCAWSAYGPDRTVIPAVADALSVLVDHQGGGAPALHALRAPGPSPYSALGCSTLMLPKQEIVTAMTCRLALKGLDHLLAPARRDANGVPRRLAADQNREARVSSREAVEHFLNAQVIEDHRDHSRTVQPTPLPAEILKWSTGSHLEMATAGRWTWHDVFVLPTIPLIPHRTSVVLNTRLPGLPTLQSGDICRRGAIQDFGRILASFFQSFFGFSETGTQGDKGEYPCALTECGSVQVQRFAQMLDFETQNILNGHSANPWVAKGGKIGYLEDFLGGLNSTLENALWNLEEAHHYRQRLPRDQKGLSVWHQFDRFFGDSADQLDRLRQQLGCLFPLLCRLFIAPVLLPKLKSKWKAVAWAFDERCADLILGAVIATVRQMRSEVHVLQEAVAEWEHAVARELYTGLYDQLEGIDFNLANEDRIATRQVIRDPEYEQALYDRCTRQIDDAFADLMDRLNWELRMDGQRAVLRLTLSHETAQQVTPGILLGHFREALADTVGQGSLIEHLMQVNPDPVDWVIELARRSEPQLGLLRGADRGDVTVQLSIAHDSEDPAQAAYLYLAIACLEHDLGIPVQVVSSHDRLSARLIQGWHAIRLDHTRTYEAGLEGYLACDDHDLLHIFPAEVNAARYEQRMRGELAQAPRVLDDRVVVHMENLGRVRLFALCWGYGVLRLDSGTFVLRLPANGQEPALQIWLTMPRAGPPSLLEALSTFDFREQDIRPGRDVPIDYERIERVLATARRSASDNPDFLRNRREDILQAGLSTGDEAHRDLASVVWLVLSDEMIALHALVD